MEGEVCLDREVLREEQLKDPPSVEAFCWLQKGIRLDKEEILLTSMDTKFLWENFDCLVVQDGLICKKIGSLVDSFTKVTMCVTLALRKELIHQCHDTKTVGHLYFWKTVNKVKRYFT